MSALSFAIALGLGQTATAAEWPIPLEAGTARERGDHTAAAALFGRERRRCEAAVGPSDPRCYTLVLELAYAQEQFDPIAALATVQHALAIAAGSPIITSKRRIDALILYGDLLRASEQLSRSKAAYEHALRLARSGLESDSPVTVIVTTRLADLLRDFGDLVQEETLRRSVIAQLERNRSDDVTLAHQLSALASNQASQGRWDIAAELAGRGVTLAERHPMKDRREFFRAKLAWVHALWASGRDGQAVAIMSEMEADINKSVAAGEFKDPAVAIDIMVDTAGVIAMARPAEAVKIAERALQLMEDRQIRRKGAHVALGMVLANSRWALGDQQGARAATYHTYALMREEGVTGCQYLPFEIAYFRVLALDGDPQRAESGLTELVNQTCRGAVALSLWGARGDIAHAQGRVPVARSFYRRAGMLGGEMALDNKDRPPEFSRILRRQVEVAWRLSR